MTDKRPYRLTADGKRRLSEAARRTALRHQPWRFSTGPRTEAGKDRAKGNAIWSAKHLHDPTAVHSPALADIALIRAMLDHSRGPSRYTRMRVIMWARRSVQLGDDDALGRRVLDDFERGDFD